MIEITTNLLVAGAIGTMGVWSLVFAMIMLKAVKSGQRITDHR